MIVSRQRQFIFFHNPKAAGTSFRRAIEGYHDFERVFWGEEHHPYFNAMVDMAHLRVWELACIAPELFAELDRYRTLVFMRHPARRLISACFEHFHKFKPELNFGQQDVGTQQNLIRQLLIKEITPQRVLSDFRYVHFSPQIWFICLGTRRVADHIVPIRGNDDLRSAFDLLELPYRPIPRENQRASDRFKQLMCREIGDFAQRFYARDYEFLAKHEYLASLAAE